MDAYRIGVKEHGEEWMRNRMRTSARRLLTNIFRTGLFENPYLDPARTSEVVGCPEFMQEGYNAQLKSVESFLYWIPNQARTGTIIC